MALYFYTVDKSYTSYLRQFDMRVSKEHFNAYKRPYVGIILKIGEYKYFAPMSSPKPKHKTMRGMDIYKLCDGECGIINFNNMIPVLDRVYKKLEIDKEETHYRNLLLKQYNDIRENEDKIRKMAKRLYNMCTLGPAKEAVKRRCCDFKLLEQKSKLYK